MAHSDDVPGVRIPGRPFLGAMGVAPSPDQLSEIDARERFLASENPLVKLPSPSKAVPLGNPAQFGLRTSPPREFGGNMDIRQLTEGSRLALAVQVQGALFSAGDTHFSQGDGESGGTAIEVAATAVLRFSVTKARDRTWQQRYPTYRFTEQAVLTRARPYFATTGIPVNLRGENGYLDLNEAAKQALTEMVNYLTAGRGYSAQQACVIASVAVDLRVSEAVDVPNPIISALLPLDIFDA
jgi:formamidase